MGYYTKFDIMMVPEVDTKKETEIMRAIAAKISKTNPSSISNDEARWCLNSELKWYNHNEHMIEVSKQFPDITFILDGEGEEHGDIWRKYYCNGEWEGVNAEITFPKPHNEKFKNL